jgi:hypothetical protein
MLGRKNFILDPGLSSSLVACFPDGAPVSHPLDLAPELSRQKLAKMCHARRSVLVTADREFVALLDIDIKQIWAILLLPQQPDTHLDILQRLFAGRLVFKPSVEKSAMIEMIGENRFVLDVSLADPSLRVSCRCRWVSAVPL